MQSILQQRFAGLQALHLRSFIATSEFYSMIGQEPPAQKVRFQVRAIGKAYHIVDLVTGKTKAFRWTHASAVDTANQFETQVARLPGGAQ
ncbi:hypothetical protein [Pseudomonas sp. GL-B-26]|uniref:hypothetical protein n=1 Tax=Pseudomonas sp. GL-B-26 TaxID=2832394 RepID=UPI001CBF18A8|nr:hypothetical protein [Pseudomonas sp. GL-B-26]